MNQEDIQESQYAFPYHHIVGNLEGPGAPERAVCLPWGLEYAVYVRYVSDVVRGFAPGRLLDIGCGDGAATRAMAQVNPDTEVLGIDVSDRAIAWAMAAGAGVANLHFKAVTLEEVGGKFDVVTLVEVLEHIEKPVPFLRSAADRLAPGGRLVISVPSTVTPVHAKHHRHYTLESLQKEVEESSRAMKLVLDRSVFSPPRWYGWFVRATSNRWWQFHCPSLEVRVWRRLRRRHQVSSQHGGRHVVAVFELGRAAS